VYEMTKEEESEHRRLENEAFSKLAKAMLHVKHVKKSKITNKDTNQCNTELNSHLK
jgi:hypothetical protein